MSNLPLDLKRHEHISMALEVILSNFETVIRETF